MSDLIAEFTLPIRVKAKARPRLGKHGGFYTPTSENEQEIADALEALNDSQPPIDHDCRCEIELGRDWFTLRILPLQEHRRELCGDLDNYAKTVLDAAEKAGVIENNRQVRELEICEVNVAWEEAP